LSQETWFKFLIPFIYSILCCPLYYAFIILNDYEKVSYKIQDHFVLENDIEIEKIDNKTLVYSNKTWIKTREFAGAIIKRFGFSIEIFNYENF